MTDAWYYVRGDKPIGPISLEDLKRLLWQAKDWREWLVWNARFNAWRKAALVPELDFPEPPPIPKRESKPNSRPSGGRVSFQYCLLSL
jgi:GYF domain 2